MIAGRQLSLNILYRAGNMATVFVLTILLSRLCGVAGYGLFSLMIANVALFSLFSAAGSDAGITYHVAAGNVSAKNLFRFTLQVLVFQLLAATITEFGVYAFTGHYFFLRDMTWSYAWPGLLLFTTVAINEKCNAWLLGKKAYTRVNSILFLSNLVMLVYFVYAWMSESKHDALFYIRAWAMLSGIQSVWMIMACVPYFKERTTQMPSTGTPVRIFTYSLFTFVINTIQFLAYRIDFWILEHFKGDLQLGWYALSVKLSQLLWVLPLLLASMIFPHTASGLSASAEARLRAWIRMMNGLNLVAGVLLALTASWLIPLLFGPAYEESVHLFRILLPGVILFCIATLLAAYFGGRNELHVNLWGSVLCLAVIGSLDLILIPVYGMRGAAIASSIGYSLTGIYFLVRYAMHSGHSIFTLLLPHRADKEYLTLRSEHAGKE